MRRKTSCWTSGRETGDLACRRIYGSEIHLAGLEQLRLWNDYVIYNNCDRFSNRPWGAGEAPGIAAVNLKTGAVTDIAKSDLMRHFQVKAITGNSLEYFEISAATEADWQNPASQKTVVTTYDLSALGK